MPQGNWYRCCDNNLDLDYCTCDDDCQCGCPGCPGCVSTGRDKLTR